MPIFDQGYQHWQGELSGHAWRWLTVTRQGVRAQMKNRFTRIIMLFALLPAFGLAAALIAWGLLEQQSELIKPLFSILHLPPEMMAGPKAFREPFWGVCFHFFFWVEMFFSMILVLLVGPGLISQDLRFNAMPLYFSRPLRRFDYFVGKLGVIGFFLASVAIVPPVVAYMLGVLFSLDFSVFKDTWRLLAASIGYGLVVVFSAGTLMLALSSLSRSSRYVALFWVGIWIITGTLGTVLGKIHEASAEHEARRAEFQVAGFHMQPPPGANQEQRRKWEQEHMQAWQKAREASNEALAEAARNNWRQLFSYTDNLHRMRVLFFGTYDSFEKLFNVGPVHEGKEVANHLVPQYPWHWSAGVLAGLFGISLCILTTRVKSLDRLR
jgi:ABC-2 type transport system permease protein